MVRVLMARGADPGLKNKYVATCGHTAHGICVCVGVRVYVCHCDRCFARWNETAFDVNKQCKDAKVRDMIDRLLRGEVVAEADEEAAAAGTEEGEC
jgi:hypothetical protein